MIKSSHSFIKLIIAITVSELAGIIGSIFTMPSIAGWYAGLAKPALNPPAWVFAPVWTTLFALMGIAAFLVWRKGLNNRNVKIALVIFIIQLVLNTLWSIIFFGLHNPGGAFIEIIFLWIAIFFTIIVFFKISRPAALLLVPYIIWVSFAGYLNYSIWQINNSVSIPPLEENELWKDYKDNNISFQYPEKLIAQYIFTQEWPPTIKIESGNFSCVETPQEISSVFEITSQRLVDNRVYCVNVKNEGAAGSVYSSYVYTTFKNGKLISVSFILIYPNCGNYDETQNQACASEREAFDLDATVDRIVQSIK